MDVGVVKPGNDHATTERERPRARARKRQRAGVVAYIADAPILDDERACPGPRGIEGVDGGPAQDEISGRFPARRRACKQRQQQCRDDGKPEARHAGEFLPVLFQPRRFFLKKSMVRCQARSAAALS